MSQHFDLFVIGAGSGGVACARASAALGARVGIAEADRLGGTCVNRGCVPKKFYVYASAIRSQLRNSHGLGWRGGEPEFDWRRLRQNVFSEVDRLNGVYNALLKRFGVELFQGRATLVEPGRVSIGGHTVSAERIMIATGGRPHIPQIPGAELGISSDQAFHLDHLPKRIAIVGGGYIAAEFASIFNGLGVETTLLVRSKDLLRGFDDDLRCHLHRELQRQGIRIRCGVNITRIERRDSGLFLACDQCEDDATDLLMFATGRTPNSDNLGLERLGIEPGARGEIPVDADFQTGCPGVYAIGDVTDRLNLTPVAIHEGRTFADTHFGKGHRQMDYRNIPTTVFCQPPLATVGLSEQDARNNYPRIDIYRSSFRPMLYALGDIEERALVKLVVDAESDRVFGVHLVGPEAAEIIQGFAVALKAGATKTDFDRTVGVHPSLAEEFVTLREKAQPDDGMTI